MVGTIPGLHHEKNTSFQRRRLQQEGATHPMLCREPPLHIPATTFVSLQLEDDSVDFVE
jgi:hypothetical protein